MPTKRSWCIHGAGADRRRSPSSLEGWRCILRHRRKQKLIFISGRITAGGEAFENMRSCRRPPTDCSGENILDSAFDLKIILKQGAGHLSAARKPVVNSIEGRPRNAAPRPPYPSECGLFGKPSVVNNAETLANIPAIIREGKNGSLRRVGSVPRVLNCFSSRGK